MGCVYAPIPFTPPPSWLRAFGALQIANMNRSCCKYGFRRVMNRLLYCMTLAFCTAAMLSPARAQDHLGGETAIASPGDVINFSELAATDQASPTSAAQTKPL